MSEQSNVVAGRRMTISHQQFDAMCERLILDEQARVGADNTLVYVLCEAVRLSREHCDWVLAYPSVETKPAAVPTTSKEDKP